MPQTSVTRRSRKQDMTSEEFSQLRDLILQMQTSKAEGQFTPQEFIVQLATLTQEVKNVSEISSKTQEALYGNGKEGLITVVKMMGGKVDGLVLDVKQFKGVYMTVIKWIGGGLLGFVGTSFLVLVVTHIHEIGLALGLIH